MLDLQLSIVIASLWESSPRNHLIAPPMAYKLWYLANEAPTLPTPDTPMSGPVPRQPKIPVRTSTNQRQSLYPNQTIVTPGSNVTRRSGDSFRGLIGSALYYRSLPPQFESWSGHIWRVFHLSVPFINLGGHSAHLAYFAHKGDRKHNSSSPQGGLADINKCSRSSTTLLWTKCGYRLDGFSESTRSVHHAICFFRPQLIKLFHF